MAEAAAAPVSLEREFHGKVLRALMAPVGAFIDDPGVSEIMINGPDEIYIERKGTLEKVEARFADHVALEALTRAILQFAGKRLTRDDLSIEARLPDGSRVHIVQPPAARPGICIAIRKFPEHRISLEGLVGIDSMSAEARDYLSTAIAMRKNVIVSGGTGSGKTTLLNAMSEMIGDGERVIVIEDASELQLDKRLHVVQFEVTPADKAGRGGASVRDLFKASLRMRPDRIIVGECRGGEALDMIQSMNSGHSGSLSTVHANNPRDAMLRLETLCLMSDVELPLSALRLQLGAAIDIIVQISRIGPVRRVQYVTEMGLDAQGNYTGHDVFRLGPGPRADPTRMLEWTGAISGFADAVTEEERRVQRCFGRVDAV